MVIRRQKEFSVSGWVVLFRKDRSKALNEYSFKNIRKVVLTGREDAFVFTNRKSARSAVQHYINHHVTHLELSDFEAIKVTKTVTIKEVIKERDWKKLDKNGHQVDDRDPLAYNGWPVVEDRQEFPIQPLMNMDIF